MRTTCQRVLTAIVFAASVAVVPAVASGQGAILDDDPAPAPTASAATASQPEAKIGFGLRLRQVFIPESVVELFVEDAPGGASHTGLGVEFIREKGNFAFVVGVEYESLEGAEGLYLDKGDQIPQDEVDKIEFDDFRWLALDVAFMWQTKLGSMFALRYGAGIGVGVILGEMLRTDYQCPGTELEEPPCEPSPAATMPGGNNRTPEDGVLPAYPIINVILGAQFRPLPNIAINVEGGIRTVPFVGTSVGYLF